MVKRTFIEVPLFSKRWAELGLTDDELFQLQNLLLTYPEKGDMIQGSGGIRKIRFPLPHKGKQGSVRVCYVDFSEYETVYFITAYAKSQKENISKDEKAVLRDLVKALKRETRHNYRSVMP